MRCTRLGTDFLFFLEVETSKERARNQKKDLKVYPFGLKHKGYNNTPLAGQRDHKYGFGGKEEQSELGLDWMDITARNYDPALGRWMNLDPLAEQMRRHSPYNYAFDNPVYWTDPDGMAPQTELFNLKGDKIGEDANGVDGKVSIIGDSKKAKAIQESYNRYKKGKSGGSLASQADVESGYQTSKAVLNETLEVFNRAEANGGADEESSIVNGNSVTAFPTGPNELMEKDGKKYKTVDVEVDPTVAKNSILIHNHALDVIYIDGNPHASNNERTPGADDFTNFAGGVVVGNMETPTLHQSSVPKKDHRGMLMRDSNNAIIYPISTSNTTKGARFYDNKNVQQLNISLKAIRNILNK